MSVIRIEFGAVRDIHDWLLEKTKPEGFGDPEQAEELLHIPENEPKDP